MISHRIIRKLLIYLFPFTALTIILWSFILYLNKPELYENSLNETNRCIRPKLSLWNSDITRQIENLPKLKCDRKSNVFNILFSHSHETSFDWVIVDKGSVKINPKVIDKFGNNFKQCDIRFMERIDDYHSVNKYHIILNITRKKSKLLEDFFWVKCFTVNNIVWSNIMSGIHYKPKLINGDISEQLGDKLNVLMFGFDSLSRLHFIRKLPQTYGYLTETMDAVVLEGYNIVGDGTPQALIPILTGFSEPELPATNKENPNSNYCNIYPFIWKNFSAKGYVTAFAEDTPEFGIFTYRLKGFDQIPTDHYMRQYYVELEKEIRYHPKLCVGSIPRHQVMLNWIKQLFDVYQNTPKFAFGFHGELSHDDFNLVQVADHHLKQWIQDLNVGGYLNNTILIIMSDHGSRFNSLRATQQGKQEERLPFFSITLPKWFRNRFPNAYYNLHENIYRISSPFDIYSTFLTIINKLNDGFDVSKIAPKYPISRSISLFEAIPENRTCTEAGIDDHWCTCLKWMNAPCDHQSTISAAQNIIQFINSLTHSERNICSLLSLKNVTKAEIMIPNKRLMTFKKTIDGFNFDFTDSTHLTEIIYQIQLITTPSDGIYEALIAYSTSTQNFSIKESDISRINKYGKQANCIIKSNPQLRKYCFCRNITETQFNKFKFTL